MIIIVTQLLFSSFVFACSECFSKCSNSDKNECLTSCGCPVFTVSGVKSGTFDGDKGQVYVPDVDAKLVDWVETRMDCSLACAQECSNQYLDISLESCVRNCGCEELLQTVSLADEEAISNSCMNLCKGSGDGCLIDCMDHFGLNDSEWYLWLVFPAVFVIILLVMLMLRRTKEDDYILM